MTAAKAIGIFRKASTAKQAASARDRVRQLTAAISQGKRVSHPDADLEQELGGRAADARDEDRPPVSRSRREDR